MLLTGNPIVEKLTPETKKRLIDHKKSDGHVALFLLSDDKSSEVYIGLKAKYAQELGIYADIKLGKDWTKEQVIEEIQQCNQDERCLGILVQLPLAEHLQKYQGEILDTIDLSKDIDGLTSGVFGKAAFGYTEVMGATPRSAFEILDYYKLGDMKGKNVLIITQSNLIGKWLTMECMHRGATIISANHLTDKELLKTSFDMAEIVFSATGVKHLIGEDILPSPQPSPNRSARRGRPLEEKVLIDIGWGSDENGPHGDIDREYFQDKVKAVTPVPGGVGPSTVASLFANMCR